MAFELVHAQRQKSDRDRATITPGGQVRLNLKLARALANESVEVVQMFWDVETCRLGIRMASPGDKGTYRVTYAKAAKWANISLKRFFRQIGWTATDPVGLDVDWSATNTMYLMVLPQEHIGVLVSKGPEPQSEMVEPTAPPSQRVDIDEFLPSSHSLRGQRPGSAARRVR
jgi:hypothetical protein